MKIEKGNLIDLANQGLFDIIIHGCNCFHAMGAGIAKEIRNRYPTVYEADKRSEFGSKLKMGSYTFEVIDSSIYKDHFFYIINAYTQYHYIKKYNNIRENYNAIKKVFNSISEDFISYRIGYPKIGAGLAGGDWNSISKIIDEELEGMDHTLVIFQ